MLHILICDDDAVFAQAMAKQIRALSAYSPKSMNVQCLTDVNAMSASELTKFDILFLDIDLGDKNVSNWPARCGSTTLKPSSFW